MFKKAAGAGGMRSTGGHKAAGEKGGKETQVRKNGEPEKPAPHSFGYGLHAASAAESVVSAKQKQDDNPAAVISAAAAAAAEEGTSAASAAGKKQDNPDNGIASTSVFR